MATTQIVLLPGTGSDARFVDDAFGEAVAKRRWILRAVDPDPADVVGGYRAALDAAAAAARGPLVVGGVSLGAAVAAQWVLENPHMARGLVVAMPAWTGSADGSPASISALATASALRASGLDATIAAMTASAPEWLSATLARSWRNQWPQLPVAMDDAAAYLAPTREQLARIDVPVSIAAAVDDPIHPLDIAHQWQAAIRGARLTTFALDVLGHDSGELGHLSLSALEAR